ncbi:MAG: AmmeMemoRadiSam system radical SAM enzyme [Candidatus Aminicenantes bacterium RBG_19FT_COMBO_58_17]|nr:MAG: AmmeMemoRadiSam system radical SAM enzyme [Candidatus Aminicenantes bacterium RBG_19FT_COMBO_58_17]
MIKEAMLWRSLEGGKVDCFLCAHRCQVAAGKFGVCGVRENQEGKLVTRVYGEVIAAHIDPIEKKPLYHFLPGTTSFSIATIGCNFRCPFCQNWQISQAGKKDKGFGGGQPLSPEEIVRAARTRGCRSISYTYTEPTIFFEYAYDTSKLAREAGLANVFVTNGYMTAEALRLIQPYLDAANVDLKAFQEETYKKVCGARLGPVLDSIRLMRELGIWVEVTTLVVPGMNDGNEELAAIARFIASVSPEIPWHISRFHPDYKYTQTPATPIERLRKAAALAREAGLKFIYVGNVWGESEVTICPQCGKDLIRRSGFSVEENKIKGGKCSSCGSPIAGVF